MNTTPHKTDAPASLEERRALDKDERAMVDQTRQPALNALSDRDLSDLQRRLRSRRDRARNLSDRQGREARSKAAPAGTSPARGNEGTLGKLDFLNAALDRIAEERFRREDAAEPQPNQTELSEKAMDLKVQGEGRDAGEVGGEEGGAVHPEDPRADKGKAALAETERRTAPSGAFDHAGELPSRERSRTRY